MKLLWPDAFQFFHCISVIGRHFGFCTQTIIQFVDSRNAKQNMICPQNDVLSWKQQQQLSVRLWMHSIAVHKNEIEAICCVYGSRAHFTSDDGINTLTWVPTSRLHVMSGCVSLKPTHRRSFGTHEFRLSFFSARFKYVAMLFLRFVFLSLFFVALGQLLSFRGAYLHIPINISQQQSILCYEMHDCFWGFAKFYCSLVSWIEIEAFFFSVDTLKWRVYFYYLLGFPRPSISNHLFSTNVRKRLTGSALLWLNSINLYPNHCFTRIIGSLFTWPWDKAFS